MTPPKEIWLVESPTAFWFSHEPVHDLPDDCVVTHMVPAQPEQEPVGTLLVFDDAESDFGWSYDISANFEQHKKLRDMNGAKIYTTPYVATPRPQRKLTDEQLRAVWEPLQDALCLDYKVFARAIEAAHGITKE